MTKIRAAFATNAITKYLASIEKEDTSPDESQFLKDLAKVMNTGTEMIQKIYMSVHPGLVMKSLKSVHSVLVSHDCSDDVS